MDASLSSFKALGAALGGGAVVLTPNSRTAGWLLEVYGRQREEAGLPPVCPTPRIFPVDIWARRAWETLQAGGLLEASAVLEPLQELLVWKKIIEESPAGHAFLNPDAAAREVREAHALMRQWDIPRAELQAFCRGPGRVPDTAVFLAWLEAWEAQCTAHQVLSLSQLVGQCIDALEQGLMAAPERFVLCGFRQPPPLYRRLFAALEKRGARRELLDFPIQNPRVRTLAAPNANQELEAAARWARQMLHEFPRARIGIVCPDLSGRAAAAQRIFNAALHPEDLYGAPAADSLFEVSGGDPLASVPLTGTALAILDLNRPAVKTLDLCLLLRSPFLAGAGEEAGARAELEYQLRRKGEQLTGLANLRFMSQKEDKPWHCPRLGKGLMELETLRRQAKGKRPAGAWLPLAEKQLACLGWPGERARDAREKALIQQWYESLAILQGSGLLLDPLEFGELPALLRSLLRNTPRREPGRLAPVQVLNPMEAEGLSFTHLWFMGLDERSWPPEARPNPFLPLAVQKRHGLPEADRNASTRLAQERLDTLVRQTAEEAVLSYPRRNAEGELAPCALFPDIQGLVETLPDAGEAGLHPLVRAAAGTVDLEEQAEEPCLPLSGTSRDEVGGGTGLLAAQAGCPFRAFALYRLGARELPELPVGLSPAARGELLHRALQYFWQDIKDQQTLLYLDPGALEIRVRDVVDKALGECANRYPLTLTPRFRELEAARLAALLVQWMEQERARGAFTVAATEHALQWEHAGLVLHFRIDRIEVFEDGSCGVVDYKSGRAAALSWLDARPDNPQLLLYQQALEQEGGFGPVVSLLVAQVNIENSGFKGITQREGICPGLEIGRQKGLPEDIGWESLKASWESSLRRLAEEFLAGHLAVDPKSPAVCQYCHLDSLCRIAEREVVE